MILYKVYLQIALGSLLVAIGINAFFVPQHFLDGGMIGIGLISHYWLDLKPGLTIVILSIPLYVLAFFLDKNLFFKSIHGLWLSSLLIDVLQPISENIYLIPILAALAGGVFVGVGIGLMLLAEAATGGTDLLAQLIGKSTGWNVGIIIFFIDTLVLLAGFSLIGAYSFLHSLLAVSTVGFFTALLTHTKKRKGFSFR
ncbi:YitT family protein [Rossellomorea vietnamensis]|uniref:YitT family protein n=2 Tax=Rossellomorea TaxID=2837508 RepID=A0A5D4KH17_9BACI|nr:MULTISPECIES: YitT family protein [Rossellomorea]TYR76581.1 YitT family protein [Rossellomorea vietnamensis]TYS79405.1 YitT family protein [Rossellomorea aquimaris]